MGSSIYIAKGTGNNLYKEKIHSPLKKHNIFRIIKDTSGIYFW